ncbi:MAG: type IV pilin protein [Xanthomonadales bacterium]|nr:type IV pilin protein [Xanthomonadales bacterium]
MKHAAPGRQKCRLSGASGYSMLEIVIVLLIVSILLAIALPSYERYTQRAHRTEAIQHLLTTAGCQARIYAQTGSYDTTRCVQNLEGRYALSAEPQAVESTASYLLIATPLGRQAQDSCGTLTLDDIGTRGVGGDADLARDCWNGR